ncbi:putative ABC transporter permease [Clostridia bacterium OttesenSCG-928-O13]|nr:putative ABC transporter permease [Clostridia bacterium OttesenSCG-928-O13]
MLADLMHTRLLLGPNPAQLVLVFFTYSFMGYVLECIVLTIEKRQLVVNRGFANHLPFCIIYGFGAILGYGLLSPFKNNIVLLFVVGALCATVFEYLVARLQLQLFGSFWWDYSKKPFNYQGILCLESTVGWGFVAIVVIKVLHQIVAGFVRMVPPQVQTPLAFILLLAYVVDFAQSAREARQKETEREELGNVFSNDKLP